MPNDDIAAVPRKRRTRRWILALVAAALAALAVALYVSPAGKRLAAHGAGLFIRMEMSPVRFALPEPTGPYAIGVADLHLIDPDRPDPWVDGKPRELMVSLWYPAQHAEGLALAPYMAPAAAERFTRDSVEPLGLDAARIDTAGVRTHAWAGAPADTSLGPLPVLIFSPGGSQPRTLGAVLVEELASRGYVVVTVDHTYEAGVVAFPGGRIEGSALPEGEGVLEKMISTRVEDIRFLLDWLETLDGVALPSGLSSSLDLSRIGIFGHSAGGFTALQAMHEDRRIAAAVNMDGSLGFDISGGVFGEVAENGLDRPFLLMGAGLSGSPRRPHTHRDAPDWNALWDQSTGWKCDVYIPEGEHFTFTDHQVILPQLDAKLGVPQWLLDGMIGTVEPGAAIASARAYLTAFFDLHLRGEPQALFSGHSPAHPFVDVAGLPPHEDAERYTSGP